MNVKPHRNVKVAAKKAGRSLGIFEKAHGELVRAAELAEHASEAHYEAGDRHFDLGYDALTSARSNRRTADKLADLLGVADVDTPEIPDLA